MNSLSTAIRDRPTEASVELELSALLAQVGAGDRVAAGRFFDRFEGEVNRLIWSLLGGDADHDDLVQECFLSLFRGAGQVRSVAAVHGWVRQVTLNTVRMELRRRRWLRLFGAPEEGLAVADERIPDEARREKARVAGRALTRLAPEERLALVLRHVEGFELTECAEALGCSLATVKRRLAKADARFQQILEGQEPR